MLRIFGHDILKFYIKHIFLFKFYINDIFKFYKSLEGNIVFEFNELYEKCFQFMDHLSRC